MWREKIKSILSWQKGREAKGRAEKKEFPELRGKQDKKELFQKAILQESRKAIQNPGCGWYHLYTFNAAQTGEPLYIACEEEELVLLRIDIGARSASWARWTRCWPCVRWTSASPPASTSAT